MMMMMPAPPPPQQQMMYQPVQMQSTIPPSSSYVPRNYMYPVPQHGMPFGYRPMMQQTRMIPSGMPMSMMATGNTFITPPNNFQSQPSFFNPMVQQLVY